MDRAPPAPAPIPAATVVLLRDSPEGPEVLLLRRNSALAFGGMWVFPGGRVDTGDADPDDPGNELSAARRAAVREAREEAGLDVIADLLIPFSHWLPPGAAPRRYATWFFVAPAPSAVVAIDGGEIHEDIWCRPSDALVRRDAGEIDLAPPTWVTLWQLAAAPDVATVLADARRRDSEHYETHMARTGEGLVALWRGDAGYDDGDAARSGARHRLWMLPTGWRYEAGPGSSPGPSAGSPDDGTGAA